MMRLPINIKQDKSTCQELKLNSTSNQQLQNKTALQTGQKVAIADLVGWVARFHTQHFQILPKCDHAFVMNLVV